MVTSIPPQRPAANWRPVSPAAPRRLARLVAGMLFTALLAGQAVAQTLPSGPYRVLDGRLLIGGEAAVTVGDTDDVAFFNYTDYEHNALRMVRLDLSALWKASRWLQLVGDIRSEDFQNVSAFAAYVRVRPWQNHKLDIQAGRIPPTFGTFARLAYATDNPVIGYPLAYQYLTSLRPDAVPGNAADLLRMRGWGWRSSFPIGSTAVRPGVPIVSAYVWDTGVQVRWATGPVELAGAITAGTLSSPRLTDDNAGRQFSSRASVTPLTGLILGGSFARGAWVSEEVPGVQDRRLPQTAFGADGEYSRGYWLVRGELIWSRWALPFRLSPTQTTNVGAFSSTIESRVRLTPRIFLGGRLDRLGFSTIPELVSPNAVRWEAPVRRVETAVGYYVQRNLIARIGVQPNWRDGGRVRHRTYFAGQLLFRF